MTRCTHLSIVLSHFQIVLPWVDHESSSFLLYCGHPHAWPMPRFFEQLSPKDLSVDYESRATSRCSLWIMRAGRIFWSIEKITKAELQAMRVDGSSSITNPAQTRASFLWITNPAPTSKFILWITKAAGWRNKSKQHLLY